MTLDLTAKQRGSKPFGTATAATGTATQDATNQEQTRVNGSDWQLLAELPANCPLYRRAVVAVTRRVSARQQQRAEKLKAIREAREGYALLILGCPTPDSDHSRGGAVATNQRANERPLEAHERRSV